MMIFNFCFGDLLGSIMTSMAVIKLIADGGDRRQTDFHRLLKEVNWKSCESEDMIGKVWVANLEHLLFLPRCD